MARQHYALYGNVAIQREYCTGCGQYALVLEDKLACCAVPTDFTSNRTIRISEAQDRRRRPKEEEKRTILELQGNRCLYCDRLFGSAVANKGKLVVLHVNWDHFVPYSYSQNNYAYNFVAACQICNGIKSNLMFKTLEEAKIHVQTIRQLKRVLDYLEDAPMEVIPSGEEA